MKLVVPPKVYESLDAFYDELPDVDRRLSGERDFGVWWTEPLEPSWPTKRLSVVENTGELYTFAPRTGEVQVLAVFDDYDEAEWALEGWRHHDGAGGLRWLRRRLESCVRKYMCGRAVHHGDFTFDKAKRCLVHNSTKCWVVDRGHERDRRRRQHLKENAS